MTGELNMTPHSDRIDDIDYCGYVVQAKNSAGSTSVRLYINRPPGNLRYDVMNLTRYRNGVEYSSANNTYTFFQGLAVHMAPGNAAHVKTCVETSGPAGLSVDSSDCSIRGMPVYEPDRLDLYAVGRPWRTTGIMNISTSNEVGISHTEMNFTIKGCPPGLR